MSYPLTLRFKILAVARQIAVHDSSQRLLMYVKQKAFKLKEAVTVFADEAQTRPLYKIAADRVIDFSATYNITANDGTYVGAIRQKGMKSLWRARYEIVRNGTVVFTASEKSACRTVTRTRASSICTVARAGGRSFSAIVPAPEVVRRPP